jgi:predicted enzyme related to lactoylglutathione lyase
MAGKPVHVELPAKDTARAKEFYGSLFGWQFESFPEMDYHMTRFDEQSGGAIYNAESGQTSPTVYFDVDDIDAAIARVRELGGEAEEKAPVPGMGWYLACKDTEGTAFSLWQTDSSASPPGQ